MDQVPKLPIEDPETIDALRATRQAAPEDDRAAIALGKALGEAGCGHEAGLLLLRPRKKLWKQEAWAEDAPRLEALRAREDWSALIDDPTTQADHIGLC